MVNDQPALQEAASAFKVKNQETSVLHAAGIKCILALYNAGKKDVDLATCRYSKFTRAIEEKDVNFDFDLIPPTEDAAKLHLDRVYFQVQS